MAVLDLGKRFQSAFGFVGGNTSTQLQEAGFTDPATGAAVVVKDGRSSWENFTLSRPDGTGKTISLQFAYTGLLEQPADVFAPPALVSFKHGKRIGETVVSSNDADGKELHYGQVVEMYGTQPIEINIKGVLVDMVNHQYPSNKVKQITDLFNYHGIWEVEGKVFKDKGITSIYLISMEDGPTQGYQDTWSFSIEAKSIKPVEYFLNQ